MDSKPSPPPPPADAPQSRQRPKRKAREAAALALSPSPPPKRQRNPPDQQALPPPPQPPRTRAVPKPRRKPPARKKAPWRSVKPQREREASPPPPLPPPPPARRPSLEEEVEAVLSRGAGVHVVPTFAGWFSWKEIHPIEKQTLATFFDGKSEKRTSETYLGIRNFIMKKFHSNPQVHLESKDLSELSIGEMDARLEVLEFLAYWGLVNFHPFPPDGHGCKVVDNKNSADTEERTSLVEKLFQFETVESYLVHAPSKADIASPDKATHFLSEPTIAEGVVASAESSVEYHCNSCSVDCSMKRYHCKTQVDFDLCSDCYNEGKFNEGMSQLDFILMDSVEVPGSGGASWTNQETLLLLEALEIFKGNEWDDIAEHVATKNKAQCMLHFLQMPILDSFLDDDNFFNQPSQNVAGKDSSENVTEVLEKMEVSTKEKANSEKTGINLADNNVSVEKYTGNSGDSDPVAASVVDGLHKTSVTDLTNRKLLSDDNVSGEHACSVVNDVLRSAFEAVGMFPEKEGTGSFTEAGNPAMALAACLSGLVEHDDALTSCHSSLRAILEISPALLLATRHCFILPDPPNEPEIPNACASPASTADVREDASPNANDTEKDCHKKVQGAIIIEKQNDAFTSQKKHQELSYTEELSVDIPKADAETHKTKDSDSPISMVENSGASDKMSDGCDMQSAAPCDITRNEQSCMSSQEASAASTEGVTKEHKSNENIAADDDSIRRIQRAACTGISAAAVKAKLLADKEEYDIWQLVELVIQKQFQKMEAKMSLITEVEQMVLRAREVTLQIRKKLLTEWNAIHISQRLAAMQYSRNQHGGATRTRLPVGYDLNQRLPRP